MMFRETQMKTIRSLLFSFFLLVPALAFADLSGTWKCDDGGNYYIRQVGKEVFWYGERSATNPTWSNVASGYVDGKYIILRWADVPKGKVLQQGILYLKMSGINKIKADEKTGGFGGSVWVRMQ